MKKTLLATIVGISVSFTSIAQRNSTDLFAQTSEINNLMVYYNADKGSLNRYYVARSNALGGGFGGRNAMAGPSTPESRKKILDLIDEYLKELNKINFDKLSINGKADYILFKNKLEDEQYQIRQEEKYYAQTKNYFPFDTRVYALEAPRKRGNSVIAQEVAKEMNEILKLVSKTNDTLSKAKNLTEEQALFATNSVKGLQNLLKNYFDFYNGYDPQFTWWVPATYKSLDSVLGAYANVFMRKVEPSIQKEDGSGIVGRPIGREELIRQLKLEFIPYTPEELIEIANKEFEWCDNEIKKASREMGFGDDWKKAQEKVKNSYVPPGQQPEAMLDLYHQSIAFLKKHDLLTIDPLSEETWRMSMMSAQQQLVSPFFLGGEVLQIGYPTNTMSYDDKLMSMRGNNPHFSRATVHHELIAGHHTQQFMNARNKTYRNGFTTPFWTEGNALYWEFVLWDHNFPRSPEDRIGMLFWRMHRCARIIFSLQYHLKQWTPQQCIDFLVDRVGHERANAEGEVRRSFTGGYGPLYQLAYMMGGLQFYALKKELVDTKKMSYKQYHDAILKENNIPIEILRAILTNQKLSKDFKTNWRFYDLGKK